MGNESGKGDSTKKDFITYEMVQETLGIKTPSLFKKYLQEVFVDLSNRMEKNNLKVMTRLTFYDYIKLPIFIAEKLFNSFSKNNKNYLVEDEFITGFYKLYLGTFEETAETIFNLLDFDKDGKIKKEDVKIILSYLPLLNVTEEKEKKLESVGEIMGFQMKSLEEIDDIVSKTFAKYEGQMNLKQFIDTVKNNKSDVFLQIICFLYQQKPFSAKNIETLKLKYNSIDDDEYDKIAESYSNKKNTSVKIKTPNESSLLSPACSFFKKRFSIKDLKLDVNNEDLKMPKSTSVKPLKYSSTKLAAKIDKLSLGDSDNSSKKSDKEKENVINDVGNKGNEAYNKNMSMVRYGNDSNFESNKILKNEKLKNLVDDSKQRYTSPTKYLQEKASINSLALLNKDINYDNQLVPIDEEDNELGYDINIKDEDKNICYENWVYKMTENNKMKKFYLVLINKDIYYYKSDDKKNFLGMHNLSGCFVQENPKKEKNKIDGKEYYTFELFFNNKSKTRKYYTTDLEIMQNFVSNIKETIGYMKFSDYYEMKESIGKGKFGVVNLGIHKKTKQQVAIKIINKDSIKTTEDKELVRIEIGVLKLCHHPNIVRLLDHFENIDYIFIVMEYIEGGTLGNYFKKKKI